MNLTSVADLRGARRLLGLELDDVARILRVDKMYLKGLERPKNFSTAGIYRDALETWEESTQWYIRRLLGGEFTYVIVYGGDPVYEQFEPELFESLPSYKMHLSAAMRAKAERENPDMTDYPRPLTLVLMDVDSYESFRHRHGEEIPDHPGTRQGWAKAYCKNYELFAHHERSPS